jgi:hypothetical protein
MNLFYIGYKLSDITEHALKINICNAYNTNFCEKKLGKLPTSQNMLWKNKYIYKGSTEI